MEGSKKLEGNKKQANYERLTRDVGICAIVRIDPVNRQKACQKVVININQEARIIDSEIFI